MERREKITLEAWRDPVSPRARLVAQKNIAEQLLIARIHIEEGDEESAIGNRQRDHFYGHKLPFLALAGGHQQTPAMPGRKGASDGGVV